MLGSYFSKNAKQSMRDTNINWFRKGWWHKKRIKLLKRFEKRIDSRVSLYVFFQNLILFVNFVIGGLAIYGALKPDKFAYTAFWSLFIAFIWRSILVYLPIVWWIRGR